MPFATTRTGSYPIGVRQRGGWMAKPQALIDFARKHEFSVVDVTVPELEGIKAVVGAGLRLGTVDLPQPWSDLASPDAGKRKNAAQTQAAFIKQVVALGAKNFFFVALPEDEKRSREENFGYLVDGLGQVSQAVAGSGARLCIEGWPGGAPLFASIICTPETCRALFRALPDTIGFNYDASHLVRMSIDPLRFLDEFMPRIGHVHAKDTELNANDLYEYGNLQQPTFLKPRKYSGAMWRYTIPGHGNCPWLAIFHRLHAAGYKGAVSIELEDANFFGEEAAEAQGYIAGRDFLRHV